MDSPARIAITVGPVRALAAHDWDQIWELTQRYVDTPRNVYEAKLREYPEVATFDVYRVSSGARPAMVIFTSSVVLDERLLADPHIRFFATVNPGHQEGDMLVCLCPLTLRNWAHAAVKAVSRGARRRP